MDSEHLQKRKCCSCQGALSISLGGEEVRETETEVNKKKGREDRIVIWPSEDEHFFLTYYEDEEDKKMVVLLLKVGQIRPKFNPTVPVRAGPVAIFVVVVKHRPCTIRQ
jgi:hypothetical protein